jgi:hypothetical protein
LDSRAQGETRVSGPLPMERPIVRLRTGQLEVCRRPAGCTPVGSDPIMRPTTIAAEAYAST